MFARDVSCQKTLAHGTVMPTKGCGNGTASRKKKGRNPITKKLLAIVLTLALCMGLVVLPASAEEVAKPEKITIFVDGTVFTESNAQDKFIERW